MELWRRNFILLSGLLEALLFSGCLFGWPSLLLILQEEGVYSHVCNIHSPEFEKMHHSISSSSVKTNNASVDYADDASPSFPSHNFESQQLYEHENAMTNDCVGEPCDKKSIKSLNQILKPVQCDEQQINLTLVYTFAAVTYGITAVFIGMSLEFLGLRVSRVIGSSITCTGFIFLAFTTAERWYFLWPALNLIAIGSNLLRFSGYQFADLWPKYKATILSSYSAGYAISTSFFILIQLIHEWGIMSVQTIFLCCAGACALTYIPTTIIPATKKEEGEGLTIGNHVMTADTGDDDVDDEDKVQMEAFNGEKIDAGSGTSPQNKSRTKRLLVESLKSITSLSGVLHTYWHFINLYLVFFYSSTFYMWAEKVASNHDQIAFYIKMSGICSLIGPCFAPFAGYCTDLMINRAKLRSNELERIGYRMQAPTYAMFVATILLSFTIACKLFMDEKAIYVSFGLIAISRPTVVGSCFSYIHLRFPEDQFNILNGFFTTFISILCFVQYPIMKWLVMSEEAYIHVHILLLVMLVISVTSPVHMMFPAVMRKYARERWMNNLREN